MIFVFLLSQARANHFRGLTFKVRQNQEEVEKIESIFLKLTYYKKYLFKLNNKDIMPSIQITRKITTSLVSKV